MALCFAWVVILIGGMVLMPEFPRYLITKDRVDGARDAMAFIQKRGRDDPELSDQLDEILQTVLMEQKEGDAKWVELVFGKDRIAYGLTVGVMLQSLQQLRGANYFFYYGATIFASIGMTNSFATSIIFGATNFASTFVGLYNVEHFGRRKCLVVGPVFMFVFFIIYALLVTQALFHGVPQTPNATTGKSKGMAIATGANWFWNSTISFFTPFITNAIGNYYGFVLAACLLYSLVFVYFFVPETKGLPLEHIDKLFVTRVKPWESQGWLETLARTEPKYARHAGFDDYKSFAKVAAARARKAAPLNAGFV